jgi:prepilin-type N-terminal cleavage/methylation domain-containing protein
MRRLSDRRPAFTLIELLVVMTIIILLAALALFVAPSFGEQQKTSLGASSVQGWLFVAKQRAYRDRLPRGVQFIPDAANPTWVRQMQYIEQPDDFPANFPGTVVAVTPGPPVVVQLSVPPGQDLSGFIKPGDFLVLSGSSQEVHLIAGVTSPNLVTLNDPVTPTTPTTTVTAGAGTPYKIIRGVRPIDGEPLLNLTQDVVVDFGSVTFGGSPQAMSQAPTATTLGGNWYVLFTPNGGLQTSGGTLSTTGKVVLWVRDSIKDSPLDGQPTLITVYSRSGAIGAYPVNSDSTLGGPWLFTQNGLNSGM